MQKLGTAKMTKKSSVVARRAWEILRALMCARKGELCRNRVALTFTNFHKLARKLIHCAGESRRRGALLYGDHEFSFQNTPLVHVRMHRPAAALRFKLPQIPCIRPQVDGDDEDDVMWSQNVNAAYLLKDGEEEDEQEEEESEEEEEEEEMSEESEEGIDERAEEFIAKFYEDMKMQRQISYSYV